MSLPTNSHCILNCLPFDVVIYILQLPCLNVHEVMLLAEAWPQYIEISLYVLRYYQLPRLRFQSVMDQEGKKQYPTPFIFHSLDTDRCRATFVVQPGLRSVSKRYISNKATAARPRLRQITLHRTSVSSSSKALSICQSMTGSTLPTNSLFSFNSSIANIPCLNSSSLLDPQKETTSGTVVDQFDQHKQCERRSKSVLPDNHSDNSPNMIRPHRLSLKEGIHIISSISSSHQCLQQIRSVGTSRSLSNEQWQYSYYVSCTNEPIEAVKWLNQMFEGKNTALVTSKQKMEHMYISPTSITVPLSIIRSSYIAPNFTKSTLSPTAPWFKRQFKTAMKKIGLD